MMGGGRGSWAVRPKSPSAESQGMDDVMVNGLLVRSKNKAKEEMKLKLHLFFFFFFFF